VGWRRRPAPRLGAAARMGSWRRPRGGQARRTPRSQLARVSFSASPARQSRPRERLRRRPLTTRSAWRRITGRCVNHRCVSGKPLSGCANRVFAQQHACSGDAPPVPSCRVLESVVVLAEPDVRTRQPSLARPLVVVHPRRDWAASARRQQITSPPHGRRSVPLAGRRVRGGNNRIHTRARVSCEHRRSSCSPPAPRSM